MSRRGTTTLEYAFLAAILSLFAIGSITFLDSTGELLIKAGDNMSYEATASSTSSEATLEPTNKPKCNQGLGNGSEGCDPGNSNNNQDSNDESSGNRGQPNS